MQTNFLEKVPKLVALKVFQISYLSCDEFLNHNTLSHYYKTHTEHIFENITYIWEKTSKLVAKTLATKFGFVPDCWKLYNEFENHTFEIIAISPITGSYEM